jgi:hypothetical protein
VAKGRKLRIPWLGRYTIVEKVTDINYILKTEGNGAMARSHLNRLERFSERLVEPQEGVSGVFPDTRRDIKGILEWKEVQGVKQFKIRSRGRNGFRWETVSDLPPVVMTAYSRIMNERRDKELEDD